MNYEEVCMLHGLNVRQEATMMYFEARCAIFSCVQCCFILLKTCARSAYYTGIAALVDWWGDKLAHV